MATTVAVGHQKKLPSVFHGYSHLSLYYSHCLCQKLPSKENTKQISSVGSKLWNLSKRTQDLTWDRKSSPPLAGKDIPCIWPSF